MTHNASSSSPSVWYKLVHMEPALVRGFVMAVFALLASIGIVASDAIPDATIGFVLMLFALIQALWTRQAVVPEEKVVVWKDENENLRAGEAIPSGLAIDNVSRLEEAAYIKGKVQ